MRVVLFNAREDEIEAIKEYKLKNKDVYLKDYNFELNEETMNLLDDNYDALVVSQITPMSEKVYEKINDLGIKLFATRSAGVDMYRKDLLKKYNIRLCNVPAYSPNAIGEFAVTSALYLSRKLNKILKNNEKKDFRWQKDIICVEMRFKTVGIVGTGRIGRAAAKLFKGLGARVIGYDLYPCEEVTEYLEYVSTKEELFKQSDIVSLHMPATEDNYHMVDEKLINMMPDNSIIVNTGRGALINTNDLLKCLDSGKLLGAALDTYEFEAPYVPKNVGDKEIEDEVFKKLLERDDILFTPHIAFYSTEAVSNLVHIAIDGVYNIYKTGKSETEVIL